MKRYLSAEFSVGTFALLGLLVIIYMSLKINDRGTYGSSLNTYTAHFQSVTGLVPKVPVEVAGIRSGFVEKIELKEQLAKVTFKIRRDIKVFEDARISIRDRGILGDRFAVLEPGSSNLKRLGDGDEILDTYSKNDVQELTGTLGKVSRMLEEALQSDNPRGALGSAIKNIRELTANLNGLVGDNQERIGRILGNLEVFTENLNEITTENKDQIHSVLTALEDVAESLQSALGTDGSIGNATTRFAETMESVQRIVDKIERGEGTVGKLINDETTVNNLNETMDGLKDTLGLFRKIKLTVRYRGEYLTSAKELQNLVGVKLAPSPDKYFLFEIVDAPVGQTSVVNTTVTSNGTVLSSTETIQVNDKVLFTFLLAKRFWNLSLRFGLIRNEGGVGADLHLLRDKFTVSVEAFDFSRVNNRAHLRTYGTLVLYKHLLLTAGVDDLITQSGGRNFFAGAGIQFSDEDLKALVSVLPGALK